MSGIRPIEMNVHAALCEQTPTFILHIHFCMAELLCQISLLLRIILLIVITRTIYTMQITTNPTYPDSISSCGALEFIPYAISE